MNATRFYLQLLKAITAIIAVNTVSSGFLRVWRSASAPAMFLSLFLCEAGTGWADENYFQVINDLIPAVSEEYVIDNGYAVYVSYDGKKILMDTDFAD